jgi:hypothetical protein
MHTYLEASPGPLARLATWSLPWLASLLISASIVYALTAMAAGAQPAVDQPRFSTAMCGQPEDRMLAYAVTTHRVPPAAARCGVALP